MAGRYTSRVTPEKIAALEGQGFSEREARRILRGHRTTPEHGAAAVNILRDREIFVTNSSQAAMRAIRIAAKNELRVSIAVYDREHPRTPVHIWTNPGHKPGISAWWLLGRKNPETGEANDNPNPIGRQNLKRYLEGTQFGHGRGRRHSPSPGALYFPDGITAMQVTIYEWDVRTP